MRARCSFCRAAASSPASSALIAVTLDTSRRTLPWESAKARNFSISPASSPPGAGLSAKKSLRSRPWLRRGSAAASEPSAHAGGDCSNFTLKSIDSESNSARLRAAWCRSKSMSHACLLLRPAVSLISALSIAVEACGKFAAKSTAASWVAGSGAEWNSSDPRRPGTREGAARMPGAWAEPATGPAMAFSAPRAGRAPAWKAPGSAGRERVCASSGDRGRPFGVGLAPSITPARAQATQYARPSSNSRRGSLRPMNTITLWRASSGSQGLPGLPPMSMCTPWKIMRRGSPCTWSTPL